MNRNLSMIFGILFVVSQIATFTNSDPNVDGAIDGDNDDYSNPNEDYGNEYENEYGNGNGNGNNVDSFASTEAAGSDTDSGSTLAPDSTVASYLMNDGVASDMDSFNDSTNVSKNDSNIPLPIIIVFVFMFTVLGVICIQQLQRMFAENKEYNNIKFEIRENRPASRSGKSYGTVTYGNSRNNNKNNKNKRKNNRKKPKFDMNIENDMDSFQNDRNTIVTILSETDEKVAESTHARLKHGKNNSGNGGYSSDDSIELGSGYDSNVVDSKPQQMKDDCDENGNSAMNSMKLTDKQKEMIAATRAKTSAKLKEQMKVATQGIKDKIEQKLHVSKLNTSKNKYKGYGTVDNNNDDSDNNDNDNDNNETNDDNGNNTHNATAAATTTSHISLKDKLKRTLQRSSKNNKNNNEEDESDESDVKHPGYTMNYGYSEDYDCDFEDSDTQLSAEGDDNLNVNNETVLKRVVLE